MARGERKAAILQLGLAAILIGALFDPRLPWSSPARDVIVVLDDSLSMRRHFESGLWTEIADRVSQRSAARRAALVRYAAEPVVESQLASIDDEPNRIAFGTGNPPRFKFLSRTATNTQAALEVAVRLAGTAGTAAVILVTDGFDSRGDLALALRHARTAGIPVYWFDPRQAKRAADRWVEALHAPATAALGERVPIAATLGGDAERRARLRITANGRTIYQAELSPDGPAFHNTLFVPQDAGSYEIAAVIEGNDDVPENNRRVAILDVAGRIPVLIVSRTGGATPLGRSLRTGGWAVEEIQPAAFPLAAGALRSVSAIVLDDIAIDDMSDTSWRALTTAVRENGVGLAVLGGPRSFAYGGYRHSTLEALLPVVAEAGKPQGRAAVQFVVDKSGSMDRAQAGERRFSFAKSGVVETARLFAEGDYTGLIWFDVTANVALPLGRHENPAAALEGTWTIRPSGGTALTRALEVALDQLAAITSDRKLLVLVTDGKVPAGEDLSRLSSRIRATGVDVISLVVGATDAPPLAQLSALNDGVLLRIDKAAELPRLMRREVEQRRNPARLGDVFPQEKLPLSFLPGGSDWPRLDGYMVTRPRPSAEVFLESDDGDPLYALGRAGAGRVAALPGGIGLWAGEWLKWNRWGQFASGLLQSIAIKDDNPFIDLQIESEGGGLQFVVDAIAPDGDWAAGLPAALHLGGGSSDGREIGLHRIAPGRFAGRTDTLSTGRYSVVARVGDRAVRRSFVFAADDEFRPAAGPARMREFLSAGLLRPLPLGELDVSGAPGTSARPLLLAVALIWFLLLLVYRRVGIRPRIAGGGAKLLLAQILHRQRDSRA